MSTLLNTSFDWDVFLSQSNADKPRVTRLAERLMSAGFRVWFDHPTIDSGEDIVTAIEQGLERSRVLVLRMTKAAFESKWVRLERNMATFRNPGNHHRFFLPLRFDDCQIPATLRRLKYIGWRTESDSAWQQLLAELLLEAPKDQWAPVRLEPFSAHTIYRGASTHRRSSCFSNQIGVGCG